jgi:hypothetical protein
MTVHGKHRFFVGLSGLIVVAMIGVAVLGIANGSERPKLPIEFRLIQPKLSGQPIEFTDIRSCSCWDGPRDQAQRKYKFRVVNHSEKVIEIDGGVDSVIRLIVAYPSDFTPHLTMPEAANSMLLRKLGSPPDEKIPVTRKIATVQPNLIKGSNQFFGVPDDYKVWALPSAPNKIAEITEPVKMWTSVGYVEAGTASYPTVVDHSDLLPGEGYEGDRRGHGTWTFYVPLPHRFAQRLNKIGKQEWEPILARQTYEKHVIFVGVAALETGPGGAVELLGFAPAPSENALVAPRSL